MVEEEEAAMAVEQAGQISALYSPQELFLSKSLLSALGLEGRRHFCRYHMASCLRL